MSATQREPRVAAAMILTLATLGAPAGSRAQSVPCPSRADSLVEVGWARYRAGETDAARQAFEAALDRCEDHQGARVGRAYVALREGRDAEARRRFREVVGAAPGNVDALVGLGILAWREGDLDRVAELFREVQRLDPSRPEAREYLSRLPEGLGPAPERPPLRRPDSLVTVSRVRGDRFEVRSGGSWRRFYVKGVNLGAALPGKYPSQFPIDSVYVRWVRQMAEAGFNAVRVYTIHPPSFYRAVRDHNRAHPDRPLWIVHGVWTELPPRSDFDDPDWMEGFTAEMRRVVDVVHGRADLPPRPGHASGHYTADVSPWTLAYLIGREWEPHAVQAFDRSRGGGLEDWSGRFVAVDGGSPMEVWLGRALDELVGIETDRYNEQRPVAYTNWPTLDPMRHVTEATGRETWEIRRAIGMPVGPPPPEIGFDDDAVGLDATRMRATDAFPAGVYAAFHAYPYYPDFMVLDPGYRKAESPWGPSAYFGYLTDLKEHHPGMPVLVAEYGVPSSVGIAQLQPQGWHHGGHTEPGMARIDARLTREIAAAGMAGGAVFSWIDEWFKANWLVDQLEIPGERDRFWSNRMDPEEHFGMLAVEPEPPAGVRSDDPWDGFSTLAGGGDVGGRAAAAADGAELWIRWRLPPEAEPFRARIRMGFAAETAAEPREPDLAFRLEAGRDTLRLRTRPGRDPFRVLELEAPPPRVEQSVPRIADAPGGLFHDWSAVAVGPPAVLEDTTGWAAMDVVVNRMRFGRDTTAFPALGYDRGVLPRGAWPDGSWRWEAGGRVLQVRIPWALLGVTDPTERRVLRPVEGPVPWRELADPVAQRRGDYATEVARAVLFAFSSASDGGWRGWPGPGADAIVVYPWEVRDEPRWRTRPKAALRAMRQVFDELEPPAVHGGEGAAP